MPEGGRQIIAFPVPGDCVGLRSVLLRTSDHSFSALTDAIVSSVDGSNIMRVFSEFPRLGAAILWGASRDEAMVVEHLVNQTIVPVSCCRCGNQFTCWHGRVPTERSMAAKGSYQAIGRQ